MLAFLRNHDPDNWPVPLMRSILPIIAAAASLLMGLASCTRHPGVAGESVVLDERLTFVRGPTLDAVTRELIAPADGTCVAIAPSLWASV